MSESHGHSGHGSHGIDFSAEFDHWLFRIVVIAAAIAYASHGLSF